MFEYWVLWVLDLIIKQSILIAVCYFGYKFVTHDLED